MKKVLSFILAFVFVIGLCATVPVTANAASVDDLTFEINDEGTMYQVSDCNNNVSGEIIIPETYNGLPVTSIGSDAFFNCEFLTSVTIPNSVTSIGEYAFYNCDSLTNVTISDNIRSIGEDAFGNTAFYNNKNNWDGCALYIGNNLIKVDDYIDTFWVKEGTKCIADYAFDSFMLSTIVLPDTITSVNGSAFINCDNIDDIQVSDENEYFYSEDGVLFNKLKTKLIKYSPDKCELSYIVPNTVTEIDCYAFCDCEYLESVTISDSVMSIGEAAFIWCESLKSITIPDSVTSIGGRVLRGTGYYNKRSNWESGVLYAGNHLIQAAVDIELDMNISEVYTIKSGTRTIADWAFAGSDVIKNITIPDSVTSIGAGAFQDCTSLKSVTVPESVITIGEKAFGYKDDKKKISKFEIFGVTGSSAEKYAIKNGFKFVDVKKVVELATPVVTVKNSATGVKVTWGAIDGAESYKVYRKTYSTKTKKYGSWKTCGTVTTTSYVDTSPKSGTKYIYTVKALNGDVKSGIKSSSSILFLSQPTVKIANNASGVKVSWNKITGATGYTIYRSVYSGGKWSGWNKMGTLKSTKTSWIDKSVKSGVKYKYTVKAVNGKTGSTYKSSSSLLYLAQPKVAVKALSNGIKVAWVQSTGATSYTIYRSEYNTKTKKWSSWKGIKTAKSTSKSYVDKTAKKGVKYRYTVKAVNGKVASSYKSSSSVKR